MARSLTAATVVLGYSTDRVGSRSRPLVFGAHDMSALPLLHAHGDAAQIAIHEVEVQVQALALGRLNEGLPDREASWELAAWIECREDAHQAVINAVALGCSPRCILLAPFRAQVLKRPLVLVGQGHRLCLDAATVDLVGPEQLRDRSARHDRQVAAEQHAVEAGQHAVNAILVHADKLLHDVPWVMHGHRKTATSATRSGPGRLGSGRRSR